MKPQPCVIVFPGSNCDKDVMRAIGRVSGVTPTMVWHKDVVLPHGVNLIVLPGGFSFGDYLRCGAIAAKSPIMHEVVRQANKGVPVIGICNGFQILTEAGLLPGCLRPNIGLKFVSKKIPLIVANNETPFTSRYKKGQKIYVPVAHHDGMYIADDATLDRLEKDNRVVFYYEEGASPNGAMRSIAGIVNDKGNVIGLMPHPERVSDGDVGGVDGLGFFESVVHHITVSR